MNTPNPKYSVLVPVFRGATTLEALHRRLAAVFQDLGTSWELILIEDCGGDNSWEVIQQLKADLGERDNIVALQLGRNFGQHNALLCGIHHARGERLLTLDDDLQNPPEEIPKLIAAMNESGYDLIYGVPESKKHHAWRNFGSDMIQRTIRLAFDNTGNISSFRLFRRFLAEQALHMNSRFVFLEGILLSGSAYVGYIPVEHHARNQGRSGYSLGKLIRLSLNLLLNYTTIPLRVIVFTGLSVAVVSFLLGLVFVARKFFYEVPMGFSALIVSIFFSLGVLLIVLGVIGEYIGRIYEFTIYRPPFSVRAHLPAKTRDSPVANPDQAFN